MNELSEKRAVVLLAASAACLVVAGFLPAPGADNSFFVILPYGLAVVCCALCFAARHDLTFRHLPPDGIEPAVRAQRVARRAMVGSVASFACAVGEVAHLLLNGFSGRFGLSANTTSAPLFAVGYVLLMLATGFLLARLSRESRS